MKKKSWIIILVVVLLVGAWGIARLINCAYFSGYKNNLDPNTAFSASDSIGFYGSFLSFVGTIILGALALYQTMETNNVSKRLLSIEEARLKPALSMMMLTWDERNKFSPLEILTLFVDDNNAMFIKNSDRWELFGNCDLVLWFLLKNMSEL